MIKRDFVYSLIFFLLAGVLLLTSVSFGSSSGSLGGGDATTLGGYSVDTGITASTIPVRDSIGSLIGNVTGISNSASTIANTVIDQGGGNNLRIKIVAIGDWNMTATAGVNVTHGLDISKIVMIMGIIRSDIDDGQQRHVMRGGSVATTGSTEAVVIKETNSTQTVLWRDAGSEFNGTDYNATSYNRGWLMYWYTE